MTKTNKRGRPLTIRSLNFGKGRVFSSKNIVKRYNVTQAAANVAIHRALRAHTIKPAKRVVGKNSRKPTYFYRSVR